MPAPLLVALPLAALGASLTLAACDEPSASATGGPASVDARPSELELARRHSEIRPDERVSFFPTYGYRLDGAWRFQLHAVVYEPELDSKKRRMATASLARVVETLAGEPLDRAESRRRLQLFLVDSESDKPLSAEVSGQVFDLGKTDGQGHVEPWLSSARVASPRAAVAVGSALLPPGDERRFALRVHLVEPAGLAVISDVDDTLKISEVTDRAALVKNTFGRPWRAVPELPERLAGYARAGVEVFYLSAMPWQLHPEFEAFRRAAGLPTGSVHFRRFEASELSKLADANVARTHKLAHLRQILAHFPERRFILLGDSGESDPEIYASVARERPAQVRAVWIRDVTNATRGDPRYRGLFDDPGPEFRVFQKGSELPASL